MTGLESCDALDGVGREVWGMAAPVLEVVKLMARHTAARLTGLVEMIRGLANPKSGGARREVHSHPKPYLKCRAKQGRRGGKDCDVQGNDSGTGNS